MLYDCLSRSFSRSVRLSDRGLYHLGESQSCILAVYVNAHLSAAYSVVKSSPSTVCSPSSALETDNKSNRVKWAHTVNVCVGGSVYLCSIFKEDEF